MRGRSWLWECEAGSSSKYKAGVRKGNMAMGCMKRAKKLRGVNFNGKAMGKETSCMLGSRKKGSRK